MSHYKRPCNKLQKKWFLPIVDFGQLLTFWSSSWPKSTHLKPSPNWWYPLWFSMFPSLLATSWPNSFMSKKGIWFANLSCFWIWSSLLPHLALQLCHKSVLHQYKTLWSLQQWTKLHWGLWWKQGTNNISKPPCKKKNKVRTNMTTGAFQNHQPETTSLQPRSIASQTTHTFTKSC